MKLERGSIFYIQSLELIETSQHTSSGNSSKNVRSGPLHQGHETLILAHLHKAVHGSLVLNSTSGGHHHAPPHGVDGVGHESSSDGDSPSKKEGNTNTGISSKKEWFECVVEAEVHSAVDEDTDCGDGEASVQALDTIRLQSLGVNIDKTIELSLAALSFGVISKPGSCVIQRVHEQE